MKHWVASHSDQGFWLATADVWQQAKEEKHDLQGHYLFSGGEFADVMALSPLLIPLQQVQQLDEALLAQGTFISTRVALPELMQHLRSLLIAGLNGEEVLFRYYDPLIMRPMLENMPKAQQAVFLGCIDEWGYWHNSQWQLFSSNKTADYTSQQAPWWVIHPELITPHKTTKILAHNLSRRLWRKAPQLMTAFDEPERTVFDVLESAQASYDSEDLALLHTLVKLAALAQLDAQSLLQSLGFDEQSTQQLSQFQEETP